MKKIPKLYSVRQVAALIGVQPAAIYVAISNNRLMGHHWVDGRWIIQEDFRIKHHGIDKAGFDYLPSQLISDEPKKDFSKDIPEKVLAEWSSRNMIKLPGYKRVTEGLTMREIRHQTKVHNQTQMKIKRGEYVRASVAVRLAKGLGIDVEELLVK